MAESLKVLIVEDNMPMRVLLRQLLLSLGIREISESTNGLDGLAIVRDKNIDVILSDLSMQPMDGVDFTKALRQAPDSTNPYVPIIMVSGHSERHHVEAARDAGVTEFLAKPITTKNLYLRINEIVERPRAFVRCDAYFGPDRRRRNSNSKDCPRRRREDWEMTTVEIADDSFLLEGR